MPIVPPENASNFLPSHSTVCTLPFSRVPVCPQGSAAWGKSPNRTYPFALLVTSPGTAGREGPRLLGPGLRDGVAGWRRARLSESGMERRAPRTQGRGGPGPRRGEGGSTDREVGGEPRGGARQPRDSPRSGSLPPGARNGRSPGGARTCVYECGGPSGGRDYKFQGAQRRARGFWPRGPPARSRSPLAHTARSRADQGQTPSPVNRVQVGGEPPRAARSCL